VERERRLEAVPYYAGILTGEIDALTGSFSGEPVLHDPRRGRLRGERDFTRYATELKAWLEAEEATIESVARFATDQRDVEENVLRFGGDLPGVEVPVAIVADRADGWITEIRVYHSLFPLTGRHEDRPPMLQADPGLREPDFVAGYQRALAAGDRDAIVAMFEQDAYVREPAGGEHVHRGTEGIARFYDWLFSNGGGIPLEHCSATADDHSCALEYNVVRWGRTDLPPQAGIAVYVRGNSGKLAAARIYDDTEPPLG
jgi:hypothetical protein